MKSVLIEGQKHQLQKLIGKGGEGEVYTLRERAGIVAKLYNEDLRPVRNPKINAMLEAELGEASSLVAFPVSKVTSLTGDFLGFTMPLIEDVRPIHELYSPKSRQQHFSDVNFAFLVRAAQNTVRAVARVHQSGCVVGDLNHSGILVAKDATVTLIDADSFQFSHKGETFRCLVGVPEFTPPELQSVGFSGTDRTPQHDAFGLAIFVFYLLFMGRHPYAGVLNGPDITLAEAIEQNRFAYSLLRSGQTQARPPPGGLTLNDFPAAIQQNFERAFGTRHKDRPSAEDWLHSLTELEDELKRCSSSKFHVYPHSASGCVWCRTSKTLGLEMFPDPSQLPDVETIHTFSHRCATTRLNVLRLTSLPNLLAFSNVGTATSNFLKHEQAFVKKMQVAGAIITTAVIVLCLVFPQIWAFGAPVLLAGIFLSLRRNVGNNVLKRRHLYCEEKLQHALDAVYSRLGIRDFLLKFGEVEETLDLLASADEATASDIQFYRANREMWQRLTFLDQHRISDADLPGVSADKESALRTFGIETAADIETYKVLSVPGIGLLLTHRLMNWRASLEKSFRFDGTNSAQDEAIERNIRHQHARAKTALIRDFEKSIKELDRLGDVAGRLEEELRASPDVREALDTLRQAENDLKSSGYDVPASMLAYPAIRG